MTSTDADSWFLAQLKPNSAHIAERNLKRQGYRTFLPMEEQTAPRGGKFVTAMKPLFPGYIFVAFDAARGLWRSVNSTYGVTRLVSFGRDPAAVPQELVAQLMERCDSSGKLQPVELPAPGDQVTVTSGPFANFVAEVERISADQRVWVLMELMGAQTRVSVDAQQLRAV
jgi:transcriptional antiterminator RfaH